MKSGGEKLQRKQRRLFKEENTTFCCRAPTPRCKHRSTYPTTGDTFGHHLSSSREVWPPLPFYFYCWQQRNSSGVTKVSTLQKRCLCWDKQPLDTSKQADTRCQSALNRASADWSLSRGRNIILRRDWLKPWWWIWVSLGNSNYWEATLRRTQPW